MITTKYNTVIDSKGKQTNLRAWLPTKGEAMVQARILEPLVDNLKVYEVQKRGKEEVSRTLIFEGGE